MRLSKTRIRVGALLLGFLLLACPAAAAESASADDTAHFLAGMKVSPSSPLAPFEAQPGWKQHAAYFDAAFARVDKTHLSKASNWAEANLTVHRPTLFYFFSGPDFLYANAFFPYNKTYVLAGLEPPGTIPDLTRLPRGSVPVALRSLQNSLRAILGYSFFRTIDMRSDFRTNPLPGTIPVLYTFMVRSGKVIHSASLVQLDEAGNLITDPKAASNATGAKGVKITFSSPGAPEQTLYYFSGNVAGDGFAKSGLKAFCDRLGEGEAFIKSASYLLHSGGFSDIRKFLLQHSAAILEDDTGVPVSFFDGGWELKSFGRYVGPISLFAGYYQPKMTQLFRVQRPAPLGFGIGYTYQGNTSSLLLAVKKKTAATSSASAAMSSASAAMSCRTEKAGVGGC